MSMYHDIKKITLENRNALLTGKCFIDGYCMEAMKDREAIVNYKMYELGVAMAEKILEIVPIKTDFNVGMYAFEFEARAVVMTPEKFNSVLEQAYLAGVKSVDKPV